MRSVGVDPIRARTAQPAESGVTEQSSAETVNAQDTVQGLMPKAEEPTRTTASVAIKQIVDMTRVKKFESDRAVETARIATQVSFMASDSTLVQNQLAGHKAKDFVRSLLTNGSNAKKDAKVDPAVAMGLCDALRDELLNRISTGVATNRIHSRADARHGNAPVISRADLAAAQYELVQKYRYGHCAEQAGAASHYLREILHHRGPVEVGRWSETGNTAVVIGRDPGSSPLDMRTWGKNAIMCDPWADEVYPLSDVRKFQQPEKDVKVFIGSEPKHYLSGNFSIEAEVAFKILG